MFGTAAEALKCWWYASQTSLMRHAVTKRRNGFSPISRGCSIRPSGKSLTRCQVSMLCLEANETYVRH